MLYKGIWFKGEIMVVGAWLMILEVFSNLGDSMILFYDSMITWGMGKRVVCWACGMAESCSSSREG